MANPFEKLFNKSADELERIENQGLAAPDGAPAPEPEAAESFEDLLFEYDALLEVSPRSAENFLEELDPAMQERIRSKRGAGGLDQPENPEFDGAFESGVHPGFKQLEADQPADEEQERQLASKLVPAMEFLYNEEHLPKVVQQLRPKGREFFEAAGETAYLVALRQHQRSMEKGEEDDPAIYFGRGGMLETLVDQMFEIGQQFDLPGSKDPNQYAGAMGFAWQRAGEYLLESGDEGSIAQAEELMMDMALTREDGSMVETAEQANQVAMARNARGQIEEGVVQSMQNAMNKPWRS